MKYEKKPPAPPEPEHVLTLTDREFKNLLNVVGMITLDELKKRFGMADLGTASATFYMFCDLCSYRSSHRHV